MLSDDLALVDSCDCLAVRAPSAGLPSPTPSSPSAFLKLSSHGLPFLLSIGPRCERSPPSLSFSTADTMSPTDLVLSLLSSLLPASDPPLSVPAPPSAALHTPLAARSSADTRSFPDCTPSSALLAWAPSLGAPPAPATLLFAGHWGSHTSPFDCPAASPSPKDLPLRWLPWSEICTTTASSGGREKSSDSGIVGHLLIFSGWVPPMGDDEPCGECPGGVFDRLTISTTSLALLLALCTARLSPVSPPFFSPSATSSAALSLLKPPSPASSNASVIASTAVVAASVILMCSFSAATATVDRGDRSESTDGKNPLSPVLPVGVPTDASPPGGVIPRSPSSSSRLSSTSTCSSSSALRLITCREASSRSFLSLLLGVSASLLPPPSSLSSDLVTAGSPSSPAAVIGSAMGSNRKAFMLGRRKLPGARR